MIFISYVKKKIKTIYKYFFNAVREGNIRTMVGMIPTSSREDPCSGGGDPYSMFIFTKMCDKSVD